MSGKHYLRAQDRAEPSNKNENEKGIEVISKLAIAMRPGQAVLFYDGSCPVCAKEMNLLKRFKRAELHLIDIHSIDNLPGGLRTRLLRRLHLVYADGNCVAGLDATVAGWSFTAWGFLVCWVRWPLIAQVADYVYAKWADRRFCRRYTCQLNVENENPRS